MHFSKRFKKAWMKSNQRMHDMLLARPKTRVLQRWPDPALERSLPADVPVAAMRAKASARTLHLARPRPRPPAPPAVVLPIPVGEAALRCTPTQRIMELARPVPALPPRTPKAKKKLYDETRCEILARRKVTFKPPKEKKKGGKALGELLPRIRILCQLPLRYQTPDLPPVPQASKLRLEEGKGYEASERTRALARPRDYAEFRLDEEFDPYTINLAALTYQATDNIKKLAEPRRKEEKRVKKG